jgi:hypothetical protein
MACSLAELTGGKFNSEGSPGGLTSARCIKIELGTDISVMVENNSDLRDLIDPGGLKLVCV